MSIIHVAFYPSDWLAGTRGLSDSETGVYITLISRMYEMAAPIERDDNRLARLCGCKTRVAFVKALEHLTSEGKIIETDEGLFNERVRKEIKITIEKSDKARAAAESRWERRFNKNNVARAANASSKHTRRCFRGHIWRPAHNARKIKTGLRLFALSQIIEKPTFAS
jgi:uncharacterized protein YdaU (DUF1376 family)